MEAWLTTLKTATPQEGFELALLLARKAVVYTQPSREVRETQRSIYTSNADTLTAMSHVVAVHFQTVAQANNYWP
jgi:endonuclease/exonuclease/phosphatase (EEP) superfamily protein YafD